MIFQLHYVNNSDAEMSINRAKSAHLI